MMMLEFQRSMEGKGPSTSSENPPKIILDSPRIDEAYMDRHTTYSNCTNNHSRIMNPKFDFPIFNGVHIKNWLMQCDYFSNFTL